LKVVLFVASFTLFIITHKSLLVLKNTEILTCKKFLVLNAGYSLLEGEGLCCSLGVIYGAIGISKLEFLSQNIIFFSCKFFQFLVIKTPDRDLH
jgi:hypothetical protein